MGSRITLFVFLSLTNITALPPPGSLHHIVRAAPGTAAQLTCHTELHVNSTVSWLAAESLQILSVGWLLVSHNPRFSLTNLNQRDNRVPGLRIERVELGDTGDYQCQVVEPAGGTNTLTVRLQVTDGLPVGKYEGEERLQKDEPVLSPSGLREDLLVVERDTTLNKLLEAEINVVTDSGDNNSQDSSTSSLLLPIISVLSVSAVILVLGVIRTLGTSSPSQDLRQENVRLSRSNVSERKSRQPAS